MGGGSQGGFLTFDPLVESQRPALLLVNGQIIVTFASQCDLGLLSRLRAGIRPDQSSAQRGHLLRRRTVIKAEYGRAGPGPATDSNGKIYVPTGNGDFTGNVGGQDFGDTILRLNCGRITRSQSRTISPLGTISRCGTQTAIWARAASCFFPISRERPIPTC